MSVAAEEIQREVAPLIFSSPNKELILQQRKVILGEILNGCVHIKDCECKEEWRRSAKNNMRDALDNRVSAIASGIKNQRVSVLYVGSGDMKQLITASVAILQIGKKVDWIIIEPKLFSNAPQNFKSLHAVELLSEVDKVLTELNKRYGENSISLTRFTTSFSYNLALRKDRDIILKDKELFEMEHTNFSQTYSLSIPDSFYKLARDYCIEDFQHLGSKKPSELGVDIVTSIDLREILGTGSSSEIELHSISSVMRANQILRFETESSSETWRTAPFPEVVSSQDHYGVVSPSFTDPQRFNDYLSLDDRDKRSLYIYAQIHKASLVKKTKEPKYTVSIETAESPLPGKYRQPKK